MFRVIRLALLALLLSATAALAAPEIEDITCETTVTSGTGTVSLQGALTNYLPFVTTITSGNLVPYSIVSGDGKVETGSGVFTDGAPDTLTRVADWSTDGAGAELSLTGTSQVCVTAHSEFYRSILLYDTSPQLGGFLDLNGNYVTDVTKTLETRLLGIEGGFSFYSNDAGAAGPILLLEQASASAAVDDVVASIIIRGQDEDPSAIDYARIDTAIENLDTGAEGGKVTFSVLSGGALQEAFYIVDDEADARVIINAGAGLVVEPGRIRTTNDQNSNYVGLSIDNGDEGASAAASMRIISGSSSAATIEYNCYHAADGCSAITEFGTYITGTFNADDFLMRTNNNTRWTIDGDDGTLFSDDANFHVVRSPGTPLITMENETTGGVGGGTGIVGLIRAQGSNDADENTTFAELYFIAADDAAGSESGQLDLYIANGSGGFTNSLRFGEYYADMGNSKGAVTQLLRIGLGDTHGDNVTVSSVQGTGEDSAGGSHVYAQIDFHAASDNNGAETGEIRLKVSRASDGAMTQAYGITGTDLHGYGAAVQYPFIVAASDETTTLTTGADKATFRAPFALTVHAVSCGLNVAATTGTFTVDINESNTSILGTTLTFDATETTTTTATTPATISDTSIAADAEIEIDIDNIGTGGSPAGLKCTILASRTS